MAKKTNKNKKDTSKKAKTVNKKETVSKENIEELLEKEETTLKEMEEQLAEWKDKHHRLYAEFDNYRRRTLKEKADLIKTGAEKLILDLLPVIDDFERAIKHHREAGKPEEDLEGMMLIYNKLISNLEKHGAVQMKCMGEEFNPDLHEAIAQIPAPSEEDKGKIVDVVENGYILADKVIRFAKVVVGV